MSLAKWVRTVSAAAIIGFGIVWSIMFPKTKDILRPDFVASVALGLGLIVTGLLIFFMTKRRSLPIVLSILLLWSALCNIGFCAVYRELARIGWELIEMRASDARLYLRILESGEEDRVERLTKLLRQVASEKWRNQPTLSDATEISCQKGTQQGAKVDVDKVCR